jgi:LysM repeat protein
MRMTTCRSSWLTALAVGAALAPAALRAQDTTAAAAAAAPQARTHTVRKGDTLWDIARMYLNDPFQWPQIYKLNTDVVEDPHWIYPGEVLKLPGAATVATVLTQPPAAAAPANPPAESLPANPAPVIPTAPPSGPPENPTPTVMATNPTAAPMPSDEPLFKPVAQTLFTKRQMSAAPRDVQSVVVMSRATLSAVRPGEFRQAPFVWKNGGPEGAGTLIRRYDVAGISAATEISRLQLGDGVYFEPPKGGVAVAGDLFLIFRLGDQIPKFGQVIIPTGVLKVERPGVGETSRGMVTQVFRAIEAGNGVIPLDTNNVPVGVHPAAVENGAMAVVVWIDENPVLASIQRHLVLNVSARDGVKPGDQYTIVRERQKDFDNTMVPEQEIGVAQVVKVTDYGSTAIVLSQKQPAIRVGSKVRLTAKMP